MKHITTLLLCLLALPVAAQSPLNANEFQRYTEGKTLFFGLEGEAYGVERYRPNRRVTWSFLDGRCKDGEWFPSGDQICFVYEDSPDQHCWQFFLQNGQLVARFGNNPEDLPVYETQEQDKPMMCLGPEIGA